MLVVDSSVKALTCAWAIDGLSLLVTTASDARLYETQRRVCVRRWASREALHICAASPTRLAAASQTRVFTWQEHEYMGRGKSIVARALLLAGDRLYICCEDRVLILGEREVRIPGIAWHAEPLYIFDGHMLHVGLKRIEMPGTVFCVTNVIHVAFPWRVHDTEGNVLYNVDIETPAARAFVSMGVYVGVMQDNLEIWDTKHSLKILTVGDCPCATMADHIVAVASKINGLRLFEIPKAAGTLAFALPASPKSSETLPSLQARISFCDVADRYEAGDCLDPTSLLNLQVDAEVCRSFVDRHAQNLGILLSTIPSNLTWPRDLERSRKKSRRAYDSEVYFRS